MTSTQTATRQHADAVEFSPDRLKSFIETRLRRREAPERIAAAVRGCFGIAFDADQVVPYWKGEITLPTQTEHRQDKESVQLPADQPAEPAFTLMAEVETPAPTPFSVVPDDAPATQTGRRQNAESPLEAYALQIPPSLHIPSDPVDEPRVTREERDAAIDALGALAKAQLGIAPDPAADSAEAADGAGAEDATTQTGRRQNQKPKPELPDEVKAFIVRGLARYETPTRVAASVKANFGIEIDRRQVYAYDPAGSRRPAQRWMDLHAATRAKFLDATSEIGVAQKVVRLRMLDRFANRMEEANYPERAAAFLAQAAKECGGFYERYARPTRAAAPASA
ncbi:DUF2280 domain-containing protein [Dongia sp.]|uniref:DUF2280 domain-containing protein n=1 Tax=Dongia sp. TaxID=1977262 RepID=UPI0037506EEE